jgi:hypothetical protein
MNRFVLMALALAFSLTACGTSVEPGADPQTEGDLQSVEPVATAEQELSCKAAGSCALSRAECCTSSNPNAYHKGCIYYWCCNGNGQTTSSGSKCCSGRARYSGSQLVCY